jgi:hypothetical protein
MLTIEVQIDHGRVTPVGPHSLPEHGRGLLTVLTDVPGRGFSIGTEADGLPVIRGEGGVITSEMVREIEGFPG